MFTRVLEFLIRYVRYMPRIMVVWYFFLGYFLWIIGTIFSYTVLWHDFYTSLADRQQTMILRNPTSRWTIYSVWNPMTPPWVFAVSTNLGTLAIDPSQKGSQEKLATFLTEILWREFCPTDGGPSCITNLSSYLRRDLSLEENMTISAAKELLHTTLITKMQSPIDAVQIGEKLTAEQMNAIESLGDPSLYFVVDNLYVNPTLVSLPSLNLANKLSAILNIPAEKIDPKLQIRQRQYMEVLKRMSISMREAIQTRIDSEKMAIKNWQLAIEESIYSFIKIEDNLVRFYPETEISGQITGFVDADGKGKYGVEWYFDNELQGESPIQKVKKDNNGRPIGWYSLEENTLKSGVDLTLTIDRVVQSEISRILERSVKEYRANKGSIIVMDPKTWAIISMANYPNYDPNEFTQVYAMEKVSYGRYPNPSFDLLGYPLFVEDSMSGTFTTVIDGKKLKLRSATEWETSNYAVIKYKYINGYGPWLYVNDVIGSLYEPGSVFKAVTTAIGLETGEVKPTDTYYDKWYVQIDSYKISNVARECIGTHTYLHALDWSCNVGMISIVQKIGKTLFEKYLYDFGFGVKSNVTLEWEVYGKVNPNEKWSRTQFFTMSFWQWIAVTQLQMAAAYSVLANWGVYMRPYIIDTMTYPDGRIIKSVPEKVRRVISEETSRTITAMLVDGVRRWFAKKWGVAWYEIAGKTWTSQMASKGWYEVGTAGHTITSYGGYAPANNPKFVLIVSLTRPRTSVYSETTSSALFAEVAAYLLNYYNIPKNS